jgi:hypothetical protein
MTDLERYLRLATWGLTGAQRKTVRLELESHVQHKTWKYRLLGQSDDEALRNALRDLGAPQTVSVGMNGVYAMHSLLRVTVLCALFVVFSTTMLNRSAAQIEGTNRLPIAVCKDNKKTFQVENQQMSCQLPDNWVRLSSLRQALEKAGVNVADVPSADKSWLRWRVQFPNSKKPLNLGFWLKTGFAFKNKYATEFKVNSDYGRLSALIDALRTLDLPVRIQGWDNPTISVGEVRLVLGTQNATVSGNTLFGQIIDRRTVEGFLPRQPVVNLTKDPWNDKESLSVSTYNSPEATAAKGKNFWLTIKDAQPSDVFIVLSREGPVHYEFDLTVSSGRRAYVARANARGRINYVSPSSELLVSGKTRLPVNTFGVQGEISVLRFTGRIDTAAPAHFTRVAPADVTVQAVQ